jgi:hypothetical protein
MQPIVGQDTEQRHVQEPIENESTVDARVANAADGVTSLRGSGSAPRRSTHLINEAEVHAHGSR